MIVRAYNTVFIIHKDPFDANKLLDVASEFLNNTKLVDADTCPVQQLNVTTRSHVLPLELRYNLSDSRQRPLAHEMFFVADINSVHDNREPYWREACEVEEVAELEVADVSLHTGHLPENRVVLIIETGINGGNKWHELIDTATFWCAANFLETHARFFPSRSSRKYPVPATVILSEKAGNELFQGAMQTLFEGLFEEVIVRMNYDKRRLRELDHNSRLFRWKALEHSRLYWDIRHIVNVGLNRNGMPGVFSAKLSPSRAMDVFAVRSVSHVFEGLGIPWRSCGSGTVLVIDRNYPLLRKGARNIASSKTGDLSGVLSDMCDLGLPVVTTDLKGIPLREQLDLYSQAGVLVAVHGAALTNLIFLTPGSSVIEIALRGESRLIMTEHEEDRQALDTFTKGQYTTVIFQDSALSFGHHYFTHEPLRLHFRQRNDMNDVHAVAAVEVNSTLLALQTLSAWNVATTAQCCVMNGNNFTPIALPPWDIRKWSSWWSFEHNVVPVHLLERYTCKRKYLEAVAMSKGHHHI
eukprot:CAMPEP_0184492940 /NCGR_PEP_ID=MMETSP0113_2-20130426/24655_1 /TAXON_ID=91329 /ORGANISM="Norrisiella sphaerica, Strain BC52" /LENGTH=523 /DNA_ID=CAMNT_0026877997 /DNA_START=192 /DNA_END=1763 /DNA_ORIENTATION=+